MRILHILDHSIPLHSGYTFRTWSILQQQKALGWQTFHLTGTKHVWAEQIPDEEQVEGLHFFRTRPRNGRLSKVPILGQLDAINALEKRLSEVVASVEPDILHAHSPALNGEAAVRVGNRYGIPVVYEVRAFWEDAAVDHGTSREWGLRYRASRMLESRVLRRAGAVTTICQGLREDIVRRGIPEEKVTVVPNAVDSDRFLPGNSCVSGLADEFGLADKVVLGFIGSFYAYEGLALLIRALPQILDSVPKAHLLLVGGGPEEAHLRRLVREQGLEEHVTLTGRVPHDKVGSYYDLIDIFVYPRLSMRLTELVTPLKPLEAMAQGRLVLASDVGGHRELIREGETGELFEAGNCGALAKMAIGLLSNQSRWPEFHRRAREYVEKERTWKSSASRYRDVYASVLGARSSS